MEERNQIQHLILNELHDDAIDRLYLKVMTENTYGGYLLAVVYPNELSISLDIIKNFTRSYPSNYIWKSLQEDPNNEQYITIVKKEFYRVGKLNVILRQLNQYNYYLTLSYLTNMITEDNKIKNIETNLEQHQDIIIKNYIEINDEIIHMEINVKSLEESFTTIEKSLKKNERKLICNEIELSKIKKKVDTIIDEHDKQLNHLYIKIGNLENINKMLDLYYIVVLIFILIKY